MNNPQRYYQRSTLTKAGQHLARMLETHGRPVIASCELFSLIQRMYREPGKKLYLRRNAPTIDEFQRLRRQLLNARILRVDRDYQSRYRVLEVSDRPGDEIVCIVDRFCHVSHLSAMQRWGFTNRIPKVLIITRPDNSTIQAQLKTIMAESGEPTPVPLKKVMHPATVRGLRLRLHETKHAGMSIQSQTGFMRVATVSQVFLDMLQKPDLCGGMAHVLEVWQEHAEPYLERIVETVDQAGNSIVKCRAGHILEERLGITDTRIEDWKAFRQRGGSRKLDPYKAFAPTYSENWMISLNA